MGFCSSTESPCVMNRDIKTKSSEYIVIYDAELKIASHTDRIPSTTPGAEPPRDARDSGSARSHSTHLETSSSDRP